MSSRAFDQSRPYEDITGSRSSVLSNWRKQLTTHEDPFHLHKALGVLCLLSFTWRFSQWGSADMEFATHPTLTVPTILLHWSLTLSSFAFKIPAILHSLVFFSRSLAILCVYYYEQYYQLEPNYIFNFAIVMVTLIAADVSSWSVGQYSGTRSVTYFFPTCNWQPLLAVYTE
jgi:hypothetical protein